MTGKMMKWSAGALMVAAVAMAGEQVKPLERIGVRAGEEGAQFVLKDSGKPFFVSGFNYVRLRKDHSTFEAATEKTEADYDPDRAEAMFSALSKAGYNTVRVFIIGRKKFNPGIGGNYDTTKALYEPYMENVLDFLRRATRHGIRVFPTFGDGGLPRNAYYYDRFPGNKGNTNVLILTEKGVDARIEFITSFLLYVKEKEPALLPTLLGLQCQNEACLYANRKPFTMKEESFTAANGKTYDMSSTEERQALMDEGYRYYHKRVVEAVKAIDPDMLVAEGVFVPAAVGKDPEDAAGLWPGKYKDERCPPMLTTIGTGALDFLDVHFYRHNKKQSVEQAFEHNMDSTGFFTPEMTKIRKKKPVIMGEFGAFDFIEKTFEEAVNNMVIVRDLALKEKVNGMLFWTYDCFEQRRLYHAASDWEQFTRKLGTFERDAAPEPPYKYEPPGIAERKPNILFVMVDDLAPDAVFENMFVTTSLCSPSRASILTGTYSHVHGVQYNEIQDPDASLPQLPQVLQEQGYKTALIGKWHMAHHADPRPGFDYWLSFKGQGVYTNPALNENGREFVAEGYISDILTRKTIGFLEQNADDPFCVFLWHKANHAPFLPAPRHADAFPDAMIVEPESWALDFAEKPQWMRRAKVYGPHYEKWVASEGKKVPERLTPEPWQPQRKVWLDMLRCMLAVDEGLGQVLDLLEKQGRLDNTVIIFMADNGWFYGEHRRDDKRLAYEESLRVPFVIRYPQAVKAGTRIGGMASNIDIAPTLLQLAGASVPDTMQGESFVPMLLGKTEGRTSPFFYEYFQEKYAPGIPTMLAIRTPEWKYIHLPYESPEDGNFDELYNLKKDTFELHNLIHSPEAAEQVMLMRRLMEDAKERYGYTEPPYKYEPPKKETNDAEK